MPELGEIKQGQAIGKTLWKAHIWQACIDCGKERWVLIRGGKPANLRCRHCARQRQKGTNHQNWKGGRVIDRYGYVNVLLQPNDFFYSMASKWSHYVREHRLIMAKHLYRCLLPWEVVHHRNGVKDDNRRENLELLSNKGKHNTMLEKEIKRQAKQIKELQSRVTLLEAELVVFNEPILATRQ